MAQYARRLSDPHARPDTSAAPSAVRNVSSMTDFMNLKGRLKLRPIASKAKPADCAVTAVSIRVAESPRLNTVYEHPEARYLPPERDTQSVLTAQTVYCPASTYQMVWEEPPPSETDSELTLLEQPEDAEDQDDSLLAHISRSPSPMRHVGIKLTAWQWSREQERIDDGEPIYIPLLEVSTGNHSSRFSDNTEDPPGPPNTEKGTGTSSARTSGPSSARQSGPQSPYQPEDDDDADTEPDNDDIDGEEPVELRFKSALTRTRSAPTTADYLTVPSGTRSLPSTPDVQRYPSPVPRQWSNLAAEEEHFQTHRDSVELYHRRLNEEKMNQQLMTTRDSFFLTKSKYESKYPRSGPVIHYSRSGGLSPIPDASPPDVKKQQGVKFLSKLAKEVKVETSHTVTHAGDREGCPICEREVHES